MKSDMWAKLISSIDLTTNVYTAHVMDRDSKSPFVIPLRRLRGSQVTSVSLWVHRNVLKKINMRGMKK